FYPKEDVPQQPAVTPDGNLHLLVTRAAYLKGPGKSLASIAADGGIAYSDYSGGRLPSATSPGQVYLTSTSDGKALLATGLERIGSSQRHPNRPVVWRIELPDRSEPTVLFGHPTRQGKDSRRLKNPHGLAVDGKGHLLVADKGNDRVVILRERDGRFVGSFDVPGPEWIGVHRKTGEVYVRSGREIIKFSGWNRPKEVARLKLPETDQKYRSRVRWYFALDAQASPAVLWMGRDRTSPALFRTVDNPKGFTTPARAGYYNAGTYWNLTASLDRREIACKVGNYTLRILDEQTGKARALRLTGSAGQTYRIGPNGQIYGMDHATYGIRRWDRNGKPMPFQATAKHSGLRGRLPSVPSGTTSWERDFGVDRQGNVYVKRRGKYYHGRMRIDVY
ncbi:hypothetical protein LCGC14_2874980, partial [marine sediment metagenome]